MDTPTKECRYVLVSPVKDEERFIETTLRAVMKQTLRPYRWIIVDDGSRDRTAQIVESYAKQAEWITLVRLATGPTRQPGAGVIRAFNEGHKLTEGLECDFIVKFDCDLDFAPDYFEKLVERFQQDPRLGIASGIYLEQRGTEWVAVEMPSYHAAGHTKMMRVQCFREIGGFVTARGWDTVDVIRAQMAGWKTGHFEDIQVRHLKPEGKGIGFMRTSRMLGEIYYMTGGGPLFFTLKCLDYAFSGKPFVLGALMMLAGYLRPLLSVKKRLVNKEEAKFYRGLLNRRIVDAFGRILPGGKPSHKEQEA